MTAAPKGVMLAGFESLGELTEPGAIPARKRRGRVPTTLGPIDDSAVVLWDDDALAAIARAELDRLVARELDGYRPMLEEADVMRVAELAGLSGAVDVLVAGHRVATSRGDKRTVVICLGDGTGVSEVTFPSEAQGRVGSVLFGAELMLVAGRTTRSAGLTALRATNAWDLRKLWREWSARQPVEANEP